MAGSPFVENVTTRSVAHEEDGTYRSIPPDPTGVERLTLYLRVKLTVKKRLKGGKLVD
ncbi:unnamed protein product, partial [Nesidiocoris tenuis]